MASERYVAINDHWINDQGRYVKQGEIRELSKDEASAIRHMVLVPRGLREGSKELKDFVASEHNKDEIAMRKKRSGSNSQKIQVQVPGEVV
jgi:hypothetical protein